MIPQMKTRLAGAVVVGTMLAAPVMAGGGVAGDVTPLFVLETSPMRSFAPDPLDAGMVRAIEMLPDRIEELPGEIPGFERSYAHLIATVLRTVSKPIRVAVVHDSDAADGPTMGYGAVFSIDMGDHDSAVDLQDQIIAALAEAGAPEMEIQDSGFLLLETPDGPPILFGAHEDTDGWRFEARFGYLESTAGLLGAPSAEHKGNAVAHMSFDLAALTPILELAKHEADKSGEELPVRLLGEAEDAGFAGANAIRADIAMSYQNDGSLMTARVENLGKLWDKLSLPDGAISRSTFDLVPADAWSARFGRFDLEMIRAIIVKLDSYDIPASEHVDNLGQSIGIDLMADLIEPLGGDFVFYTSESTGGGGLASSVMLMEVRDREKMLETNQKLIDLTNMMVMMVPYAGRYIRITPWEYDGMQLFSLRFPGTPVPLELTFGYEGDWAFFAVTPQGAIAACNQIRGKGDEGLGSVRAFTTGLPNRDLFSASFVNSEKVFRGGYGAMSIIGSGLANLARSPWDRARDPGLVVPPYGLLKAGIRPNISWSYWDGDALEVRATGSRSMIANMAVQFGKSGGMGGMGGLSGLAPMLQGLGNMR
jgi:hypothetical protein